MSEPLWKTYPYKITGWICICLILLVAIVDLYLAIDQYLPYVGDKPTISQYVTARKTNQPLFGCIVIGGLIYLGIHWFWKKKK